MNHLWTQEMHSYTDDSVSKAGQHAVLAYDPSRVHRRYKEALLNLNASFWNHTHTKQEYTGNPFKRKSQALPQFLVFRAHKKVLQMPKQNNKTIQEAVLHSLCVKGQVHCNCLSPVTNVGRVAFPAWELLACNSVCSMLHSHTHTHTHTHTHAHAHTHPNSKHACSPIPQFPMLI